MHKNMKRSLLRLTAYRLWVGLFAVLLPLMVSAKLFVPELEPWSLWVAADESSSATVDHAEWQQLLNAYVSRDSEDGINRFAYAAVTPADRSVLRSYIDRLAAIDPRNYARAEQLAYWVNLYNALTVQVVLDHYPVKSIRKINGGLLGTGPWDDPLIEVAGESLSLNDIEHRILRPIWRDPRIHYVVNCASLGCPDLAAEAYSAATMEARMDAAARAYINHPRGVDLDGGRMTLSSIYNWYDSDFGAGREGLLAHLSEYAEAPLAAKLGQFTGRIGYDYDWRLNEP